MMHGDVCLQAVRSGRDSISSFNCGFMRIIALHGAMSDCQDW